MDFVAVKVRCIENQRTGAKAWIFYSARDARAYLSGSKCHQLTDDHAALALFEMKARENRELRPPVKLYCVKGRTQLLVHRIMDNRGLLASKTRGRLI